MAFLRCGVVEPQLTIKSGATPTGATKHERCHGWAILRACCPNRFAELEREPSRSAALKKASKPGNQGRRCRSGAAAGEGLAALRALGNTPLPFHNCFICRRSRPVSAMPASELPPLASFTSSTRRITGFESDLCSFKRCTRISR
jgi:hypothetical protein